MEDNFQRLHRPAIAFDAILGPIVQLRQHMERLVQDTRHADYRLERFAQTVLHRVTRLERDVEQLIQDLQTDYVDLAETVTRHQQPSAFLSLRRSVGEPVIFIRSVQVQDPVELGNSVLISPTDVGRENASGRDGGRRRRSSQRPCCNGRDRVKDRQGTPVKKGSKQM